MLRALKYAQVLFLLNLSISSEAQSSAKQSDTCLTISNNISSCKPEFLKAHSNCGVTTFHLEIFDRWGTSLYTTEKFSNELDFVTYKKDKKGNIVHYPEGNYFWVAKFRTTNDTALRRSTGNFVLIR
jgi:hypothetical protein